MTTPTLPLASVTDTDCIRSMRPLVLGRVPGKYVIGPAAILRRVLYRWCVPKGTASYDPTWGEGLLTLPGTTLSDRQILGYSGRLKAAAESEDYVLAASAPISLSGTTFDVPGSITLVDGRTYPLEVALSSVGAALRAIGA